MLLNQNVKHRLLFNVLVMENIIYFDLNSEFSALINLTNICR